MSSQTHRDRLRVLHHLARLGTATVRALASEIGIPYHRVSRAIAHNWFVIGATQGGVNYFRLSDEGRAAELSSQEDDPK